jgi:hypothetical protein
MRRLGWSLFNFDIDDATLKPEHQTWLNDNLVPLLSIQGASVALRGTASRSGNAAYNKQLSDKRVETVRNFLLGKGARMTQLTASSTGENEAKAAGQADGSEDARFRSVVVELALPVSTITPRFDRDNLAARNDGFDPTETFRPPWVLVRVENAFRLVRLINGQGLELISTDTSVVEIEDPVIVGKPLLRPVADPQFIRLRANNTGDAEIQAIDTCGTLVARLRVAVRAKLTVKAAFHYVQNKSYGTKKRKLGDEDPFLVVMNNLYRDQANIQFEKIGARNLAMTANLGTEINSLATDQSEWNTVTGNRNPAAQFNVFLVREVETDAEGTPDPSDPTGKTMTDTCNALTTVGGNGDCLLEDDSSPAVGVTLAHECGHCLGVRHNSPIVSPQSMLMFSNPNRGHFIPRIHAELMRKGVKP